MARSPKPAAKTDPRNHHLTKRGDTWWCVRIVEGKRLQATLRTADVVEARIARDRLVQEAADIRAGRVPDAPAPSPVARVWEDAVEGYLHHQALKPGGSGASGTAKRYAVSIRQLSMALEGQPLTEITTATILDYIDARREDGIAASTLRADLTAWSAVLDYADQKRWIPVNPVTGFNRKRYIGRDPDVVDPPSDQEVADIILEIRGWSAVMSTLLSWLRETGMRLNEALQILAEDIHPGGLKATLKNGVKRNDKGDRTRTIFLGRASALLDSLPPTGRLFASLPDDSAAVSTRYGQWHRQRQARADRAAASAGKESVRLRRWRLHDLRHAFAIASLLDDATAIYRLQKHLGHSSVTVTEKYLRHLGDDAPRRYIRMPERFGSLPAESSAVAKRPLHRVA